MSKINKNAANSQRVKPSSSNSLSPPQQSQKVETQLNWAEVAKSNNPPKTNTNIQTNELVSQEEKTVDWRQVFAVEKDATTRKKRAPISLADAATITISKPNKKSNSTTKPPNISKPAIVPKQPSKRPNTSNEKVIVNPATGVEIQKRGKEKREIRPKKPTRLKMAILEEREDYWNELNADNQNSSLSSSSSAPSESQSINVHPNVVQNKKHVKKPVVAKTDRDFRVAKLKSLQKPQRVRLGPQHRSYVRQIITEDFNHQCFEILSQLYIYHLRAKSLVHKNPSKSKRGRRIVFGIREVTRSVMLKKSKFIIVAPNIEEGTSIGGLSDVVSKIIESANQRQIPVIFALTRRKLGQALNKSVRVSIVSVINVDGCYEQYTHLIERWNQLNVLSAIQYKMMMQQRISKFGCKIQHVALVDGDNPKKILKVLKPYHKNTKQSNSEQSDSKEIYDINLAEFIGKAKRIQLRAITVPEIIGGVKWTLQNSSVIETVHQHFEEYPPYILSVQQGRFLHYWHLIAGNFTIKIAAYAEFYDKLPLDVREIELNLSNTPTDGSDSTFQTQLLEMAESQSDSESDLTDSESSWSEDEDEDKEEQVNQLTAPDQSGSTSKVITPSSNTPTASKSIEALTDEEKLAAEMEAKRQKRLQKRLYLQQKLEMEQREIEMQEEINRLHREKHKKEFPDRPALEETHSKEDYFQQPLPDLLAHPILLGFLDKTVGAKAAVLGKDQSDSEVRIFFIRVKNSGYIVHILPFEVSESTTVESLLKASSKLAQVSASINKTCLSIHQTILDPKQPILSYPELVSFSTLELLPHSAKPS